jgi:transposase
MMKGNRSDPKKRSKPPYEERLRVFKEISQGRMTQSEASVVLKLTERQIRRIYARFARDGTDGLLNKSIGQPGHHRIPETIMSKVVDLARSQYREAGPTYLSELLEEQHNIKISRETLRRILHDQGIRTIEPGKTIHRRRRERRSSYGMLVQMDTSYHDWFSTGEKSYLICMIDDATSTVFARFFDSDSTRTNMAMTKLYSELYGFPLAIYTDKASHFKVNAGETREEVISHFNSSETQLERAFKDCGIIHIHAHSPQAKGRVERLNRTLQDRLVKRLRYENITDIDAANEFLDSVFFPAFNSKFTVKPVTSIDCHKSIVGIDLDAIFSIQVNRTVTNDFTFRVDSRKYQIAKENDLHRLPKSKIIIEKRLDGSLHARHDKRYLLIQEITKKS